MIARYRDIVQKFDGVGEALIITPCHTGLINTTLFVDTENASYVLQKINTTVFKDPEGVMKNIVAVTDFLKKKGHPTLTFLKTKEGSYLVKDHGNCFRLCEKLEGKTHDTATADLLMKGGEAFGAFQAALSDFDASVLVETIPDFHNTPARVESLWEAVSSCQRERLANAVEEIKIVKQFAAQAGYLMSLLKSGDLPLRVVHNDTKINNVLFAPDDSATVLDLDTVMPGSLLFDFGDAIRSGASTRAEGDLDFKNFAIDKVRYEAFLMGFLSGAGNALTETEKKLLPFSAFVLAFELGVRFLTDYLNGDVYFKTSREGENLDRAKGQLALCQNIFFRLDELSQLTKKYSK